MAVTSTYTTLQTNVGDYLARSDLSAYIPVFIQNFEERFYRDSDNWASWMETAFSSATVASGVVAVPSAYLGLKIAYMGSQNSPPLKRISLAQLYQRYPRAGSTGVPAYIARNGANFEFGPIPSDGGTLSGTYYAKPTLLRSFAADAAAHHLIVNAPDLLLYGALLEAEPFLKNDDRIMVWKSFYDAALAAYRARFKEEDHLAPMMVAG